MCLNEARKIYNTGALPLTTQPPDLIYPWLAEYGIGRIDQCRGVDAHVKPGIVGEAGATALREVLDIFNGEPKEPSVVGFFASRKCYMGWNLAWVQPMGPRKVQKRREDCRARRPGLPLDAAEVVYVPRGDD